MIDKIVEKIKKDGAAVDTVMLYDNGKFSVRQLCKTAGCHALFSISKNFTATAVGIAMDKGLLTVNDKITDWLRGDLPQDIDEKYEKVEIRHLLSNTTGIDEGFLFESDRYDFDPQEHDNPKYNWLERCLKAEPKHEPGTLFCYSNSNYYILSCIISRATGQTTDEFLRTNLFEKLGISLFPWERSPQNETAGATGLYLYPTDMFKLGILYMNNGIFNGQTIVSEKWVREATTNQVKRYGRMRYGYSFWITDDGFMMKGSFGQIIRVFPERSLIFGATANEKGYDYGNIFEEIL